MDERQRLEELRARKARLEELRAKAGGAMPIVQPESPPQESSILSDLAQGGKSSLDQAALGIKGLLPQWVQDAGDNLDRKFGSGGLTQESAVTKPDSIAGNIGAIGTDIGLGMVAGAPILKGAGLLKNALRATKYAKTAVPAALALDVGGNAAVSAALAPEDRGTAAALGAGGSVLGATMGRLLGGAMRESVSPQAQKLIDADVFITPGQAMSGPQAGTLARLFRGTEDKITSIPFVGDVVTNAQQRSMRSFNTNRINDALSSVGGKVKNGGLEGLDEAHEIISNSYDTVLPHIQMDSLGAVTAISDATRIAQAHPLFDVGHINKFDTWIDRRLEPLIASGAPIDGKTFKALDAEMGELARKFRASGIGNEPLGDAFSTLRDAWRQHVIGTTPEAKQVLENANKAYAKLLPLEDAGAKSAQGFFTPKQLADSLRRMRMDPDELAQAGRQVLPSTIPDSGTAGRAALATWLQPSTLGAGTAAAAGLAGFTGPAVAAAGLAGLYTKPGLKMATQGVHPLVKALRGNPQNYDPNSFEDLVRNLTGRTASATFGE